MKLVVFPDLVNGANAQRMEKSGYRHAKELKTVLTAK